MNFIKNPFKEPLIIEEDMMYILEREDISGARI
jgi:hypothetical protein